MLRLFTVARILLGLSFFVFGLNGFLHFLPQPPMQGPPGALVGALVASGYLMTLVKGTEVLGGLLLLGGRQVPLALTLLAPIIVNILTFHVFLAPAGMALPLVLTALEIAVAWAWRDAFLPMFRAQAPAAAAAKSVQPLRSPLRA